MPHAIGSGARSRRADTPGCPRRERFSGLQNRLFERRVTAYVHKSLKIRNLLEKAQDLVMKGARCTQVLVGIAPESSYP